MLIGIIFILTVLGIKLFTSPFIDQDATKGVFLINGQRLQVLYLYRVADQKMGFKHNPDNMPLLFTWSKPIDICFNMTGVDQTLYIYFFDKDKKIIGENVMQANDKASYCPANKILYALETIKPLY